MISLLLLAAMFLVAATSRRLHETVLTPWAIHLLVWLGMLFLYSLNWMSYISVEPRTWLLLGGSLIGYALGALNAILAFGLGRRRMVLPTAASWFANVNMRRYGSFLAILSVLGIVGAIGYFQVVRELYGLSTLLSEPGLIRSTQSSPEYTRAFFWWKFLFYLNWLAIPLAVARIVYEGRRTPKWVYLSLLVPLAVSFAQVSRAQIVLIFIVVLVIVISGASEKVKRLETLFLALVLIVPAIYFVLAGEALGKTYEYSIGLAGGFYGPQVLRPAAGLYNYITGNIPAFQAYMYENSAHPTYGLFQLLPLFKILGNAGLFQGTLPEEVGEFLFIPFPFNTYTYLNVFYKDWGVVGVLLGPFLFGALSNWLYLRTCNNGRVWLVVGSAFVIHASLVSLGTNVLISTPQWEYVVALFALALYTRERVAVRRPELASRVRRTQA